MAFLNILRSEPHLPEIQDADEVKARYKYWRWRIFYSMYVGYVFYYFTRKSFSCAIPGVVGDLGFKMSELGMVGTVFAISYGLSKFLSGAMADRSNPRYFMAFGLIATGIINILFGWFSSLPVFLGLWALNGFFQGWGWPPCAKLLTHWFSQNERGRWWSWLNTSLSLGSVLMPFIAAHCIETWGWRSALYVPGCLCIVMGMVLINRLRDIPQTMGLPPVEKFRNDAAQTKPRVQGTIPLKTLLVSYILNNPYLWILSLSYFFLYVVRQSVNDYSALFLIKAKGYDLMHASAGISFFEGGGLCGALAAGWLSDVCFGGRRCPVILFYGLGAALAVFGFYVLPGAWTAVNYAALFAVGFCVFGPQMLIGMAAAEMVDKKAAATANGFAGWCSYLGAAAAGYPIAKLTEAYGWNGFAVALVVCGVMTALPMIPLWRVKTYVPRTPAAT